MFELPNQIRIFDFFSAFVRQLNMILVDSAQIVTMLASVVFFFMFIFWILDKTATVDPENEDPDYEPFWYPGGVGLIRAIIDSYRMALGDFEITTKFGGDYEMMYWVLFFFGTFIALLIILNMVIAVMSASFAKVEEANSAHIMREKLEVII
jgi:hypothetical protein